MKGKDVLLIDEAAHTQTHCYGHVVQMELTSEQHACEVDNLKSEWWWQLTIDCYRMP